MKNFFTSLLGALAALVIFAGGASLLFVGILGAIVALNVARILFSIWRPISRTRRP